MEFEPNDMTYGLPIHSALKTVSSRPSSYIVWPEFEKLEIKLERYVIVGKTISSWKDIDIVGKIHLSVKLGRSRRISSTKFL